MISAVRAIRRAMQKPSVDGVVTSSEVPLPQQDAVAAPKTSMRARILLMVALLIPVFLETLDYTVVATAQAHIASTFNSLSLQSYIGTVYLLTSTVFLPLFASLADIWGRHNALQLSIAFFMIGSAISTGSQNMPTMLVGRGIAGIGAAGLQASVRIILTDSKSLDENNWQQSVLFFLYTIGYCVGPYLGGALTSVSFRWIFAINLPASAIAAVLAFLILRGRAYNSTRREEDPSVAPESFLTRLERIDWIGAAIFMAGGILVLLALNWGSVSGWGSAKVVVCFVVGGILEVAFGLWEYTLERRIDTNAPKPVLLRAGPMLPPVIFRSIDICIVQYATFVSGMIMLVMFYFVSIFLTIVSGYSPTKAGAQLIYFAPGMGGGALVAIQLIKRLRQPKIPILLGGATYTIALGLISKAMNENNQNQINGFMAMAGGGVGLSIGPLAVHARFSQPNERLAIVSCLSLFSRALGGTVGLAQCGAVLNAKVNSYIRDLVASGSLSASDAQALAQSTAAGLTSLQDIDALPQSVQTAVRNAYRQGSRWSFISLIPWAVLAFLVTLFLSKIHDSDREGPPKNEGEIEMSQSPKSAVKQTEVEVV